MGGRWIRVDALVHENPKVLEVGFRGLTVIQCAWRLSKAHDLRGELPAHFWTPTMLARYALAPPDYLPDIEAGMAACLSKGLVECVTRDDRDRYMLHDWGMYQRDQTAAVRQKRHRDKKKAQQRAQKPGGVTSDGVTGDEVTQQDPTEQDNQDTRVPEDMIWRIQREFDVMHENVHDVRASHSDNIQSKLEDIKKQFDFLRKPATTDDQYLNVVRKALEKYFETTGDRDGEHRVWHFRDQLPGILKRMKEEAP